MRRSARALLASFALILALSPNVLGWSAHGHRTIAYLALEGLPAGMPDWIKDPSIRSRIADQSNEPDRWRGLPMPELAHENGPDHYLDVEDLKQYGLTLETISPFRYEFIRDMSVAAYVHPENLNAYDPKDDKDRTKQWPGFLPHAILEHYNKLKVSFNTYRILAELNDPARADQLEQAKENCIYEMGILSHFVGDAAQPLHTTTHHHGWVGPNPAGYTTDRGIHSYIDGAVVDLHHLSVDTLRAGMKYDVKVDAADPWKDTLSYIRRSFDKVEPLYKMQKDGSLPKQQGKEFISDCLRDAGATLSSLYAAAWQSSKPDERQIQAWVRYSGARMGPSTDGVPQPRPAPLPQAPLTPPPPPPLRRPLSRPPLRADRDPPRVGLPQLVGRTWSDALNAAQVRLAIARAGQISPNHFRRSLRSHRPKHRPPHLAHPWRYFWTSPIVGVWS